MRKQLMFLFIFLIFIVPTIAQPPFQESTGTDTAVIIYPKDEYFEYNKSFNLHLHMINSTGYPLSSNQIDCLGHFYSTQNAHLLEINSIDDSNGYDDYFVVNQTVTGNLGTYPYNIYCNTTQGEYAYVSYFIEITNDSEQKNNIGTGFLTVIILIPLIFGLFLLLGAMSLSSEHNVLRIILFLFTPITTWVSLHYAMIGIVNYYGLFDLQNSISKTTYWSAWVFFVLVSYFIIYAIWKAADTIAQKKESRINY